MYATLAAFGALTAAKLFENEDDVPVINDHSDPPISPPVAAEVNRIDDTDRPTPSPSKTEPIEYMAAMMACGVFFTVSLIRISKILPIRIYRNSIVSLLT